MSIEGNSYGNKQIGNSDFKSRGPLRAKRTSRAKVDISDLIKVKMEKFSFPGLGITIEAESLEDAVRKLEDYKKKK